MQKIKIDSEYITLGQLLKVLDFVSSGGEVKFFLSSHTIKVNEKEENRRGFKLYINDEVLIEGEKYLIC